MSVEFKKYRVVNGKRSRKNRKWPRKKITSDIKRLRFRELFIGWDMCIYEGHSMWRPIHNFIKGRIGQDVNDVFSEFVSEIKKGKHYYKEQNYRDEFWNMFNAHHRWGRYIIDEDGKIQEKSYAKKAIYNEDYIKVNKLLVDKPLSEKGRLISLGYGWVDLNGIESYEEVFIMDADVYDFVVEEKSPFSHGLQYEHRLHSLYTQETIDNYRQYKQVNLIGFGKVCEVEDFNVKVSSFCHTLESLRRHNDFMSKFFSLATPIPYVFVIKNKEETI